jgi:predicted glycosyltransferase
MIRLLFYSPDAVGLGHVRRLLKIAHLLAQQRSDVAMLLITGSATTFHLERRPPHLDYLKLPSFKKVGPETYLPRDLPIPHEELLNLRASLVLQTVASFRPDIVFVDHNPLGREGELQRTLGYLREEMPQTRLVFGLRDILDDAQTVRRVWREEGVYKVLQHYYDLILVYGTPDVFNVVCEYAIPAAIAHKLQYCGYIGLDHPPQPTKVRQELGAAGKLVVATVGAGEDGYHLLDCFLEALQTSTIPLQSLVITGPLMAVKEREKLCEKAEDIPNCRVLEYVPDLPSVLAAADLVISMYGYNIATELAALGKVAIVVPRSWPRREQMLRACALAERGLVDLILPDVLTSSSLAERIQARLNDSPVTMQSKPSLDLEGLSRIVHHLMALLEARAESKLKAVCS